MSGTFVTVFLVAAIVIEEVMCSMLGKHRQWAFHTIYPSLPSRFYNNRFDYSCSASTEAALPPRMFMVSN